MSPNICLDRSVGTAVDYWAVGPSTGLLPAFCPAAWRPQCKRDHSAPSSTKVKNGGAIPPPHMPLWHTGYKLRDKCAVWCVVCRWSVGGDGPNTCSLNGLTPAVSTVWAAHRYFWHICKGYVFWRLFQRQGRGSAIWAPGHQVWAYCILQAAGGTA
jgi:hypothetical protein